MLSWLLAAHQRCVVLIIDHHHHYLWHSHLSSGYCMLPFDDVVGVAVSNVGLVTAVAMAAADEEAPPLCISDLLPPRDDDIRSLVAAGVPVVCCQRHPHPGCWS